MSAGIRNSFSKRFPKFLKNNLLIFGILHGIHGNFRIGLELKNNAIMCLIWQNFDTHEHDRQRYFSFSNLCQRFLPCALKRRRIIDCLLQNRFLFWSRRRCRARRCRIILCAWYSRSLRGHVWYTVGHTCGSLWAHVGHTCGNLRTCIRNSSWRLRTRIWHLWVHLRARVCSRLRCLIHLLRRRCTSVCWCFRLRRGR